MKVKIKVTEDAAHAALIRKGLKDNDGYCPCRVENTPDTKCMCKEFRDQAEGICHCGLYIKVKE